MRVHPRNRIFEYRIRFPFFFFYKNQYLISGRNKLLKREM